VRCLLLTDLRIAKVNAAMTSISTLADFRGATDTSIPAGKGLVKAVKAYGTLLAAGS
jgi:hypothetical protein